MNHSIQPAYYLIGEGELQMQFNIKVYSNTNTTSGSKQVVQLHPDDSE
jgi:hypothetical protein